MDGVFLSLGTNQGDCLKNLSSARTLIQQQAGKIVQSSPIYKTAAWGKKDQPDFFNQVVEVDTPLDPETLLNVILKIELSMGRERIEKWGVRIIDIDIILYGQKVYKSDRLIIPHPQLEHRRFALVPMAEIAGDVMHPLLQKTIHQLLRECSDALPVHPVSPSQT